MEILPRKDPTVKNTAQEVDSGTERRILRQTEVTIEREVLSIRVRAPAEVDAERKKNGKSGP